ncbi:hypothetical protein F4561_003578 [Lipingzhangella halophila]|uniref:Uncharacterized protein n=1 Tax=Lipingzhangella halophila TaxID=1783352 RepID=A0A7W7W3Q3_9ACTN|nr:hypothetical protein [Lipingzhangella halophila]
MGATDQAVGAEGALRQGGGVAGSPSRVRSRGLHRSDSLSLGGRATRHAGQSGPLLVMGDGVGGAGSTARDVGRSGS